MKSTKTILTLFIISASLISAQLQAQHLPSKFPEAAARQNVYVELGGNGIAFNAMYESRFRKAADGAGLKVGIGGFTSNYEKVFTLPVG